MESYANPGHWSNQTKGLCFDLLKGSAILFSATSFLFQRQFLPVMFVPSASCFVSVMAEVKAPSD